MTGKLIVIEGIDGSGKTTQTNLLSEYLKVKNIPHEIINFPRYEDNLYGKLIRRYLEGEFGGIDKVDPHLMSLAYAGDRALAKPLIENWLNEGKLVIANRYNPSNKAHMSAHLPQDQREEFMSWLDQLEFETNKIPKGDLNLFLDVTPKVAQSNVRGEHTDIHEQNLAHLEAAYQIYVELSKSEDNWKVVECMEGESLKVIDVIHQKIVEILEPILLT
jgi:dTMP kinase